MKRISYEEAQEFLNHCFDKTLLQEDLTPEEEEKLQECFEIINNVKHNQRQMPDFLN